MLFEVMFEVVGMKRLIKNGVLVDAQGEYRQDLLIEHGVIRARAADIQPDGETEVIDASGCYVMPGGIDVHTHFNIDVGIARSCDDFFRGHARWSPNVHVIQQGQLQVGVLIELSTKERSIPKRNVSY